MLIETELSRATEKLNKAIMLCHHDDFKIQSAGTLIRESLDIINYILENLRGRPPKQHPLEEPP